MSKMYRYCFSTKF